MSKVDSSPSFDNPGFDKEPGDGVAVQVEGPKGGERLTYTWKELNVFAPAPRGRGGYKQGEEKHILKDVSGVCRPGELLAIIGASGAGKTTLLNVLDFRSDTTLRITGKLCVNGHHVTPGLLTSRSAYVQQEDLFIGTCTVREQLVFQANLRMDRDIPQHRRMTRVDEVMQEFSLVKCAETLIGIPDRIKGISGGETKRLAFACEILTNPPLMFCDEPTTGLDSFMAQNIIKTMRLEAASGKTIISTIHQPSSEVFALFDRVLLMAEGRVAYLGSAKGALDFFGGLGRHCPSCFNPADFFISNLAICPYREAESRAFVGEACDAFAASTAGREVVAAVMENDVEAVGTGEVDAKEAGILLACHSPYKAGWWEQFGAVLKRSWLKNFREPTALKVKVIESIFIGLLVGLIYLDQDYDQPGASNINGAIFLLLTHHTFTNCLATVNTFCADLPVFQREHKNGMYRVDVYFIAKSLVELPFSFGLPTIFLAVMYYMVGLSPGADRFFICVAIVILASMAAVSFGYLVSCMAKDLNVALAVAPPLLIPLILFGGFFLNSDTVPVYFIWIKYMSWFNFANEALIINQWASCDKNITCDDSIGVFCLSTGQEVLDSLGYSEDNFGFNLGLIGILIVSYRLLAFVVLFLKSSPKQSPIAEI